MRKLFIYYFVVAGFIIQSPVLAMAQERLLRDVDEPRQNTDAKERRDAKDTRKEDVKNAREDVKMKIQEERDAFKKRMDEARLDMKAKAQERRDVLKTQLEKVKDERKRAVVQKVDASLDDLNKRVTAQLSNVLDKLGVVLGKISSRADKAQANGLDIVTVKAAIEAAHAAIVSAQSAVQAQSVKTYPITINSDATLRIEVNKVRRALHDDLKKVRESVKAAHDAVRRAAVSLAKIHGVDDEKREPAPVPTTPQTNQ
ncbi:MAG: hypothetical protein HYR95_01300 [Candidatus Colwellbacteria bacterium]|nr:hypothetical protein [Candidatus Colwellbacteria bacterium]